MSRRTLLFVIVLCSTLCLLAMGVASNVVSSAQNPEVKADVANRAGQVQDKSKKSSGHESAQPAMISGFTVLAVFKRAGLPLSNVVELNGQLYGTTYKAGETQGGVNNGNTGEIWRIQNPTNPVANAGVTPYYNFGTNTGDGTNPQGGVISAYGYLINTTTAGGAYGYGQLSGVSSSGSVADLHDFTGGADGGTPQAGPTAYPTTGAPNFYGTTTVGGANGGGAIYFLRVSPRSFTTLYNFPAGSNPGNLGSLATDASGNLYGTTENGGSNNQGSVWEFNTSTSTFTTLYSFGGGTGDGCTPYAAPILDASGSLYGTTYGCGAGTNGTVWKLTNNGGTYSEAVLYNFCTQANCSDGANPEARWRWMALAIFMA